jgi:hypothetical protein
MSNQFMSKDWNPAIGIVKAVDAIANIKTHSDNIHYQTAMMHQQVNHDNLQNHTRETPTPENTGAPVPGYKKRGSNITPESTGAPVPGANKPTGKITPKHTRAYPKKLKQTPPGTKPKKK